MQHAFHKALTIHVLTLYRDGEYVVAYRLSQPSTYQIDVRMITGFGLVGEYYM